MLGGSLAAQPEHETISVNRTGSPPFVGWNRIRNVLYHKAIADCRLPIANLTTPGTEVLGLPHSGTFEVIGLV